MRTSEQRPLTDTERDIVCAIKEITILKGGEPLPLDTWDKIEPLITKLPKWKKLDHGSQHEMLTGLIQLTSMPGNTFEKIEKLLGSSEPKSEKIDMGSYEGHVQSFIALGMETKEAVECSNLIEKPSRKKIKTLVLRVVEARSTQNKEVVDQFIVDLINYFCAIRSIKKTITKTINASYKTGKMKEPSDCLRDLKHDHNQESLFNFD